jgi:outer membrane protein insertion porin family/translocation and assembly module TamA
MLWLAMRSPHTLPLHALARLGGLVVVLIALLTVRAHAQAKGGGNDQREAPEVRKLTMLGADHVDKVDLTRSIATRQSKCRTFIYELFCLFSRSPTFVRKFYLDRDELRRDVLRVRVYYWKRGYRETTVDTSVTKNGDGVNVTFKINEGPPTILSSLRIEYDTTLISQKRLRRVTTLKTQAPLNLLALDTTRLNLQSEMWNRGYGDAIVDTAVAVNPDTRRAAVFLRVFPNWPTTVGSIAVRGNQRVDSATIINTILLRSGKPYKRDDVLESQRSLYESNLFRLATILPPTGDSIKNLEIQVVEAPLRDAHIGGGVNNVDFGQLEGRYTSYNLFGGARRLDITTSIGNLGAPSVNGHFPFRDVLDSVPIPEQRAFLQPTWSASADFRQPSFLRRPRNQVGVGVFAHRNSEPGVYIDRGYGGTATFTRQVASRASASLGHRFEITRVEASDVYFCVDYGVCDTTTISSLRSHQRLSPLALSGYVDRSDAAFFPTRGYVARVELEHASRYTISDYRYNRAFVDVAGYWHHSGSTSVVAGHLRLGFVRPFVGTHGDTVLHPRKRFYSGGAMSVRGYGENQLGPRVLTIDPDSLRGLQPDKSYANCAPSIPIAECDPNAGGLRDPMFQPRALGGTSLLEGSVEYRFPLLAPKLFGAAFVDGGIVGEGKLQSLGDFRLIADIARSTAAITPGLGVRYNSPVGPIRVDIGYHPMIVERLLVVTSDKSSGQNRLVPLTETRIFGRDSKTLLSRLALHFSIGQAY